MPDLGIDVLFKGTNMLRLLGGLWVAARISLISIVISMPLGILVGAFMTMKNKIVRAICRIYLEIIRIMPSLYCCLSFTSVQQGQWAGTCPVKLLP